MNDFKPYRYQVFNLSPLTPESRIWRYMTFEKFCWLIETSKLWHTRLDQFSDPFEGSVTEKYAQLRQEEPEPPPELRAFEPWNHRANRFRYYACCWHESPHESDAQWQLYASGGAGVAIVSTLRRLRGAVEFEPHVHGLFSRIDYVDFHTHPVLGSHATNLRPEFVKRKSFEHEREVRGVILKDFGGFVSGGKIQLDDAFLEKLRKENPLGIAAKVELRELLEAIVISPLAAGYVEELVRIVTKRYGFEHLVCKSQLCGEPVF